MRCRGMLENLDLAKEAKRPMLWLNSDRVTELKTCQIHMKSYHSAVAQTLQNLETSGTLRCQKVLKVCYMLLMLERVSS